MPTREQPSHAVIVERLDNLAEMMRLQFANGARRFDRIEERLGQIEEHQVKADEARAALTASVKAIEATQPSAGPFWWPTLKLGGLIVLGIFAGFGLGIVALTRLDVLGPIMDAAAQAHEMSKGN